MKTDPVGKTVDIAVIGGGAAGFFAAITCAEQCPEAKITIYEKSSKVLVKVRISGGGRCNVTNACTDIDLLLKNYPRGGKELRGPFNRFSTPDTVNWFESRGVKLKAEKDNRMFPVSDDSADIANCLLSEVSNHDIQIRFNASLEQITKLESGKFRLKFMDEIVLADKVLIASGGQKNVEGFHWLEELGLKIISPVPSLFTFNMPGNKVTELMGVSVSSAEVKIADTKFQSEGPLLVTHWGMSGPAILKLSSYAARTLAEMKYQFNVRISWLPDQGENEVRNLLNQVKNSQGHRLADAHIPFPMPKRLWQFLLDKSGIIAETRWADLSKDKLNNLLNCLCYDSYAVSGKTTFREEFVTSGGIDLSEVNFKSMESRKIPGLFFAGEILDIDAVTGGFNFQAAWTTAYIAGLGMSGKIQ